MYPEYYIAVWSNPLQWSNPLLTRAGIVAVSGNHRCHLGELGEVPWHACAGFVLLPGGLRCCCEEVLGLRCLDRALFGGVVPREGLPCASL